MGQRDHFSSKGKRLKSAAGIIRQDRANFHKLGLRDSEDQGDPRFGDIQRRAWLGRVVSERLSSSAARRILDGNRLVEVTVKMGEVTVRLLD